jgi:uncharacterized protein (DUF697 family)
MTAYETIKLRELHKWEKEMLRKSNIVNKLAKKLQTKMNSFIPEKAHKAITATIKQMIKTVLFGAEKITQTPLQDLNFEQRENAVENKISNYQKTAAAEGGITGAGGILLGLADFPILLAIKIKLLFDIAAIYGYDVKNYKERLYILHIFQLAFCSKEQQRTVYLQMNNWSHHAEQLPEDINELDWRTLQQEYRDYIDIAKMLQLVPVIGAPVGAIVNYRLIRKLGETAKNAYRMRLL